MEEHLVIVMLKIFQKNMMDLLGQKVIIYLQEELFMEGQELKLLLYLLVEMIALVLTVMLQLNMVVVRGQQEEI